MSCIDLRQTSSCTLHATTLLTGIFTLRVHRWAKIKAACNNAKYTEHLILVTEEDARKRSKRRTANTGFGNKNNKLTFSGNCLTQPGV